MTFLDQWRLAKGDIRPATNVFLVILGTLLLTLSILLFSALAFLTRRRPG